jgi:hypothetical protein
MLRGTLAEVVVVTRVIKVGVTDKIAGVVVGGGVGEGAVVDAVPEAVVVRLGRQILVALPKSTIPTPIRTIPINFLPKGATPFIRENKHKCARGNDHKVQQATPRMVLYARHAVVHGPHDNTHWTVEIRQRFHWMLPPVTRMHIR